jgi:hypothetical protein
MAGCAAAIATSGDFAIWLTTGETDSGVVSSNSVGSDFVAGVTEGTGIAAAMGADSIATEGLTIVA